MIGYPMVEAGAPPPKFQPKDASLLTVLGAIQLGHKSLEEIIGAAKHVAESDWQPTGDLIRDCIRDALEAGLIQQSEASEHAKPGSFAITEAGVLRLFEMLSGATPTIGRFGQLHSAMKVCFLGAFHPQVRGQRLEELRRRYEGELTRLRHGCRRCPCRDRFVRLWMDHEIGRLEWELAWLDRLHGEMGREDAFA